MAFDPNGLALSVDTIAGGNIRTHFYTAPTDDVLDNVLSSDYIPDVAKYGMRLDDFVFVRFVSDEPVICTLASINAVTGDGTLALLGGSEGGTSGFAPRNIGFPSVSGTVEVGETLEADIGGWSQGLSNQHWQWFFDNRPKQSADQMTYIVEYGDVGKKISFGTWGYTSSGATFGESDQTVAVPELDILDAFTGADDEYLFDFTRTDSMFTDAEGTLPADATDDEIQAVRNFIDDSIEALTQAGGAGMQVYEEADGTLSARTTGNRRMVFDRALLPTAPPFAVFIGAMAEERAEIGHIFSQFEVVDTAGNVEFAINCGYSADGTTLEIRPGRFVYHIRGNADGGSPSGNGQSESSLPGPMKPAVMSYIAAAGTNQTRTRLNGWAVDTCTTTTVNTVETRFGANTFLLGGCDVRMYAVIITHYVPSDANIALIESWLKQKTRAHGITPRNTYRAGPTITAQQSITVDCDSGEVLFGKEPYARNEVGSMTKLMTVHLTLKHVSDLEATTTISEEAAGVGGSGQVFLQGDVVTIRQLLDAAALPSSNQAARALAEYVGDILLDAEGTPSSDPDTREVRFVLEMNAESLRLGMLNTNWENATGLDDAAAAYSTARDMTTIMIENLNDPMFVTIFSQETKSYSVAGREITLNNTNPVLTDDNVIAGKTGATPSAQFCFTFGWRWAGRRLATSSFGSTTDEDRAADARAIMDYVEEHFTWDNGQAVFTA